MKNLEFKKIKIVEDNFLEVEYTETERNEHYTNIVEVKKVFKQFIHQDLRDELKTLIPHLAALCELVTTHIAEEICNGELHYLDNIVCERTTVTQVVFGGEDEHAGITLVGRRVLKNRRVLNLVAPFTKFFEENEPYPLMDDLMRCLECFENEVRAYILEGKYAPNPQTEINFEEAA